MGPMRLQQLSVGVGEGEGKFVDDLTIFISIGSRHGLSDGGSGGK